MELYKNCDEHPDVAKILRYGSGSGKMLVKTTFRGYPPEVRSFWDENVIYITEEEFFEFYQKKKKEESK